MTERLKVVFQEKIAPKLIEKNNYKNKHQVPVIEKIVINRGLGNASQNTKILEFNRNLFYYKKSKLTDNVF